jgi:hypothetical protein
MGVCVCVCVFCYRFINLTDSLNEPVLCSNDFSLLIYVLNCIDTYSNFFLFLGWVIHMPPIAWLLCVYALLKTCCCLGIVEVQHPTEWAVRTKV